MARRIIALLAVCAGLAPAAFSEEARPVIRPEVAAAALAPEPPAWLDYFEGDLTYIQCLAALEGLEGDYEILPPQSGEGNPDCGIARPLQVQSITGVRLEGGALMRCEIALGLGHWLRDFAIPAIAHLPDAPQLEAVVAGSTYSCRERIGDGSGKPSQHGLGNAFDIAALNFVGGESLPIMARQDQGDHAEAVQGVLQASACLFFTTVLGPGSNDAHDGHLHLDVIARPNGWRICQ